MVALNPPVCDFGWKAPGFCLRATDGSLVTTASARGTNGLLVIFMCNHCPYVQAIIDRIIRDAHDLLSEGIGVVAINSNDAAAYPDDSFECMVQWATEKKFPFPYLHDDTQAVARAYGAVCTPDFFGFNASLELQYRGRLDSSGRSPAHPEARRELLEAMTQIARSGQGPAKQIPSIGCSIKWRA